GSREPRPAGAAGSVRGCPPDERVLVRVRGHGDHGPGGDHAVARPRGDRRRHVPGQSGACRVLVARAEPVSGVAGNQARSVPRFLGGAMDFGVVLQTNPPASGVTAMMQRAAEAGLSYGWTWDSPVLWLEPA